jgi:hypothetical protein
MKHTRWLALLLVWVGPFVSPLTAQRPRRFASPPEAKKYIELQPEGDLSQILNDRLLAMRGQIELEKFRQQYGDKRFPPFDAKNLADPALQKLIQDVLAAAKKDAKFDPEGIKGLEALIKKPPAAAPADKQPEPRRGQLDPPAPPPGNPQAGDPGMPPQPPAATPEQMAEGGLQEKLSEWAQGFAHRLEGTQLGDRLRESPAWQKGMKALEGFLTDRIGGKFQLPGGGLGPLGDRLRLPGDWGALLPDPGRFHLPNLSLPSLHRPHLNFDLPRPSFGGSPVPGGVPGVGDWGGARVLLWVGLFALIGLFLWKMARRAPRRTGGGEAGAWQLGPWPVDPARVATRAELVQAFEYLALLRLGRDARAWNHRDIAAHLGGADAARGQAAGELAALYEQARYAPDDEPLAAPDLGAARRNLCLLAEVATA